MTADGWRDWVTAATRPRLIGIFVLLVVGALVCIRLGAWQIDRAQLRGDQAAAVEQAQLQSGPPVPLADLTAPQTGWTQAMVGQRVTVTGTYDPELQFVVPHRGLEGRDGTLLVAGLRVDGADPAVLTVVRGWVPAGADVTAHLDALPDRQVDLVGYLAGSEPAEAGIPTDATTGAEIPAVSVGALVNVWGAPMYAGQLLLETQSPAGPGPAPEPVGPPVIEGGGLDLQNLAYAAEWFIFGGFALVLWWRMVRDEVRHTRAERAEGAERAVTA